MLSKFGIQKVFKIIRYLEKKQKKKIVSIYTLVNLINQSITTKQFFFVSYLTANLVLFLGFLKQINYIFNYCILPKTVLLSLQ